jgi:hypothetical protein
MGRIGTKGLQIVYKFLELMQWAESTIQSITPADHMICGGFPFHNITLECGQKTFEPENKVPIKVAPNCLDLILPTNNPLEKSQILQSTDKDALLADCLPPPRCAPDCGGK